jgi:hypothetical protein
MQARPASNNTPLQDRYAALAAEQEEIIAAIDSLIAVAAGGAQQLRMLTRAFCGAGVNVADPRHGWPQPGTPS